MHRPSAKFALLRMPDAVASLPLAQATLELFASVWERRYENIYPRGEALSNVARKVDHLQADLAELIVSLVGTFIGKCRSYNVLVPCLLLLYARKNLSASARSCLCRKHTQPFHWPLHKCILAYSTTTSSAVRHRLARSHPPPPNALSTIEVASSQGWHFDAISQVLTPVRIAKRTEPAPGIRTNPSATTTNKICSQPHLHF